MVRGLYTSCGNGKIRADTVALVAWIMLGMFAAYQIVLDPLTWDSIVATGLFLLGALPWVLPRAFKAWRLKKLFTLEYQPSQDASALQHRVDASHIQQRVPITIRMTLDCYVEFVALYFEGHGTLPVIQSLDDWQWGRGGRPPQVYPPYTVPNDPRGTWYWQYQSPHHRLKHARITIGIDYLATDYFDGHLVVRITTTGGARMHTLPFSVLKRASSPTFRTAESQP